MNFERFHFHCNLQKVSKASKRKQITYTLKDNMDSESLEGPDFNKSILSSYWFFFKQTFTAAFKFPYYSHCIFHTRLQQQ